VFGADVNPHLTENNTARSNIGNGEPTNQPRRSPVAEERSSEESDILSGHTERSGRTKHVMRDREHKQKGKDERRGLRRSNLAE
jgi:hypothetical protein